MEKLIKFYDSDTNEEIEFEVINGIDLDGQKYLLVSDEDDEAAILKEIKMDNEEIIYDLVEDENEFQKVTLMFMENGTGYKLEF